MKILLDNGAFMPTKAHEADAGYDLYSPDALTIPVRKRTRGYRPSALCGAKIDLEEIKNGKARS